MKIFNDNLTVVDGQKNLGLARPPKRTDDPPMEVIARIPNRRGARKMALQWSGLLDNEVADALGIDHGQWSRIMNGKAHFPDEKHHEFNQVVGNKIVTMYDAYQEGCELTPLESELERHLPVDTSDDDPV